jgi:tetratricopeptide (TPR) repeat protein
MVDADTCVGILQRRQLMTAQNTMTPTDIDRWRQAIRQDTFSNYHFEMGEALAGQGETAAAIDAYRRAIDAKPDFGAAHFRLIEALAATGNQIEREAAVACAERQAPAFASEWQRKRAQRAMADGRHDEAIEAVSAARALAGDNVTDIDDNLAEAYYLRGLEHRRRDRPSAAITDLAAARRHASTVLLDTVLQDIDYYLGPLLWDSGDLTGAQDALQRDLDHNPDRLQSLQLLGAVQLGLLDLPKAEANLTRARSILSGAGLSMVCYNTTYLRLFQGRLAEAEAEARQALESLPGHPTRLALLAFVLAQRDKLDEANNLVTTAFATSGGVLSTQSYACTVQAFALLAARRYSEVIEMTESLEHFDLESWPPFLVTRGCALDALGRAKEADAVFRAAWAVNRPYILALEVHSRIADTQKLLARFAGLGLQILEPIRNSEA